jgi:type IV pilus assembly protein PilP
MALLCTLALAGCKEQKKAPAVRPAAKAAAAAPSPSAAQTAAAQPAVPQWSYSGAGKRDPFRSFLAEIDATHANASTRCTTPLGRFELEQLKLVAVVTGLADPVAMVETPAGVGYSVRPGMCIGKNGGTVAAVRSGELVVSEWAVRADGTRDKSQTVLRLPKEASLNLEEQVP